MSEVTKEQLQKLLDNVDMERLNSLFKSYTKTAGDLIVGDLQRCQKVPSLHDKLIELCENKKEIFYKYYIHKKNVSEFIIYLDVPVVGYEHFDIIIYPPDAHNKISVVLKHTLDVDPTNRFETDYEILNELLCTTHDQVFEAIYLFEKWGKENG